MIRFVGNLNPRISVTEIIKNIPEGYKENGPILVQTDYHFCDCDEFRILCFGTIYNIEELRYAYDIPSDHPCKVIHDLFVKKGDNWIKLADGDFTVIMFNQDEMYLWRDRHGAGPQIYFDDFLFMSHPSLFKWTGKRLEPDLNGISTFLGIGYIPSPQTALKGVRKVPAGHMLKWSNGKTELQKFYSFEEFLNKAGTCKESIEDATMHYQELHKKVIQKRIHGANKVGLLLSGGYDSGGNIHTLRQTYNGPAEAISIGFKDNPWTEIPLAKLMADEFHTTFHSYEIDGSELTELPEIVEHMGDPFQEGGLMVNFMAMKTASKLGFEVILGGDGNDQHFGTSAKELALNWKLKKMGLRWAQLLLNNLGKNSIFDSNPKLFRLRFHNDKILHIIESDCFGYGLHQIKKIIPQANLNHYQYSLSFHKSFDNFDEFYFARNYLIDIEQVINEVILFKASRIADLFGNRITFPYMATEIYNFLQTLPRNLKCKGSVEEISTGKGIAKFLHKNYLKPVLPPEITSRKKQGGFAPLPLFFKDETQRRLVQAVIRKSGFYREIANKAFLEAFFNEYEEKALNENTWFWYRQIAAFKYFNLLVIALWWEIHITGKEGLTLSDFA